MNCPICKKESLKPKTLLDDLRAYQCDGCNGIWIPSERYYKWLRKLENTPEIEEMVEPIPLNETPVVKISPETGSILRRYQIWSNKEFFIDRDEKTQSIWLDKGEWEYLLEHHLHDNIHLFFMPQWQKHIRDEESKRTFESLYLERFGAEDYAHIKDIREWIYNHPKSNLLIAFLLDKDPYKAA